MEPATTSLIVLKELAGNPPPQLNTIQTFLEPHMGLITTFWITAWIITAVLLVAKLLYEYRQHARARRS